MYSGIPERGEPRGPVKAKPLQISFTRVSVYEGETAFTLHQLWYSGTDMRLIALQSFIIGHADEAL